ncbi:MAG TPA: CHC2 zinc finger domain-containing protein [Pedobacter sp.]|nr:CHC2 zinc finger domain-containing protein [Pedobacter sp.]
MKSPHEMALEIKSRVSLADFLSRLGFQPMPKQGRDLKYLSMLRDSDTDPSFTVNERDGLWRDWGTGKGGDIIDFAREYWKGLSFTEAVEKILSVANLEQVIARDTPTRPARPRLALKVPHYKVENVGDLGNSDAIRNYLTSRGVWDAAQGRMKEVFYYVEDEKKLRKRYFAAGWQNEAGGWEIRNKYFKGCLGKKALTVIPGDSKSLAVFEGYLDYLSWRTDKPFACQTAIVLNSLVLLDRCLEKAKQFSQIDLYMDHDKAGMSAALAFQKALPYAVNRSSVFDGFNDYNDKIKSEFKQTRRLLITGSR